MRTLFLLPVICAWLLSCPAWAGASDLDHPPIHYSTATPDDAVTALSNKIRGGKVALKHDDNHGYLASLLEQLDVPRSSQVLVFSRTSLQRSRISPKTPRA